MQSAVTWLDVFCQSGETKTWTLYIIIVRDCITFSSAYNWKLSVHLKIHQKWLQIQRLIKNQELLLWDMNVYWEKTADEANSSQCHYRHAARMHY